MSFVQLESFVVVAEEGNLHRAARRLHVSQPPLTRRIRALEDELGVALFERTRQGMRLLPAGETLLDHAKTILREVERARVSLEVPGASESPAWCEKNVLPRAPGDGE